MYKLSYRNQTIIQSAPINVCRWKKKSLIASSPLNWLNPYFTIEEVNKWEQKVY